MGFAWRISRLSKKPPAIHGNDRVLLGGGPEDADLAAFLTFKASNQGRSKRTAQAYGDYLERLRAFLGGGRRLVTATADELVTYCGPWLNKQGVHARARRPYIAAVREFFKWAHLTHLIKRNPAGSIEYPKTDGKLPTVISLINAEKLLGVVDYNTFAGVRDAAMMSMLIGCGLRITGLVNINEEDLSQLQVDGELRLQLRVKEKGEKERILPVPRVTEILLRCYLDHPELKPVDRELERGGHVLFISTRNRRVSPEAYRGARRRITARAFRDVLVAYGKRAGVPRAELRPHAMRHLFGTELAEGNVDLLLRQELLGHSDAKSTKIYDRVAMRRKFKAADDAGPLAKMKTPVHDFLQRLGSAARSPAPASKKPNPSDPAK